MRPAVLLALFSTLSFCSLQDGLGTAVIDQFCEAVSLNSTAEEKLEPDGTMVWAGNKTEIGILSFLKTKIGVDPADLQKSFPAGAVKQFPFDSEKKRMTTVVKKGNKFVLYVKGAPDILLAKCSSYMSSAGKVMPMSKDREEYLNAVITDMALLGNRCILVAVTDLPGLSAMPVHDPEVHDSTCIAILGIQDPVREEVPSAVKKCQKAGITVRMVTGDNKQTACSIAEKAGIFNRDGGLAMEGLEFRNMAENDPAKLIQILPKLQVLARSSPQDKYVLVDLLKKAGHVVAVTGDGTNDAPALKLAQVGFAMASGTAIAQTASDIVLRDDNFVSVVKACMWGRNVNDNIKKFLQFQVTVNIVGVALTFFGAAFSDNNEPPFTPVQLLWLNLIMDTLAALALATEKPSEELLDRMPSHKDSPLITSRMWVNIIGHAIFQFAVLLGLMGANGAALFGIEFESVHHKTIVFNTFILIQIWNEFNARKLHGEFNIFSGIERSIGHLQVTVIMVVFQFCAVQYFGDFFGTHALNAAQWFACIALGALCVPYGMLLNVVTSTLQIDSGGVQAGGPGSGTSAAQAMKMKKSGTQIVQAGRVVNALQ